MQRVPGEASQFFVSKPTKQVFPLLTQHVYSSIVYTKCACRVKILSKFENRFKSLLHVLHR